MRVLWTEEKSKARVEKWRRSERAALAYFERRFGVSGAIHERPAGPDLVFEIDGALVRVEVKCAFTKGGMTWATSAVYPDRRDDDYVAVVLPDYSIFTYTMVQYRRLINPYSVMPTISVTGLVRSRCPLFSYQERESA